MSSFEAQNKIQSFVAQDMAPESSTVDILSSISLISKLEAEAKASPDGPMSAIIAEELKFLRAGIRAVREPAISARFGSTLASAQTVAQLLKAEHSKNVYSSLMKGILDSDSSTNTDEAIKGLSGGGSSNIFSN